MQKLKSLIKGFFDNLRTRAEGHGYVCDRCGVEIFTYPQARLCDSCERLLPKNEKTVCPKCGRKTVSVGVCVACKSRAPAFEIGYSPFVYQDEAAALVNRMKNGEPWLACYFGECMADGALDKGLVCFNADTVLVVPIPMGEKRRKERGYNQAERLAEAFCARLKERGIETERKEHVLFKRIETLSQKDVDKQTRRKNAEDAYRVKEKALCKERVILLIDDIMTTGATGSVCAEKLLKVGAKRVIFITACALPEQRK